MSERELEHALEDILSVWGLPGAGEMIQEAWVDKQKAKVIVSVSPGSRDSLSSLPLTQGLEANTLNLLDIVESPTAPSEAFTVRGGINASSCTWGFTVNNDGTERLTTAGHCGSSQTYAGVVFSYLTGSEINSGNVDMQLHDVAGNDPINQVYLSTSGYRTINASRSWASNDIGDAVCHRGKTTGYTCGHISSVTGSQAVGGGTRVLRASGAYLAVLGGDSGGPVVFGSSALGTCEGANIQNPPNSIMIWTTIEYSENFLSMEVLTS